MSHVIKWKTTGSEIVSCRECLLSPMVSPQWKLKIDICQQKYRDVLDQSKGAYRMIQRKSIRKSWRVSHSPVLLFFQD